MENNLVTMSNNNKNLNTGLTIIGDQYKAQSGFLYASGYRDFGDLKIIEDVASGTAVSLLIGIKVFDKEGILIIDKRMEKGCYYEREIARNIVLEELLKMLESQNNTGFKYKKAKKVINKHLEQAYYNTSYKAITSWGEKLGIIKK